MTAEGRNALASFHEWRKRLVITDLRMAPMNGIELCRQIRAQSNVPIIVVSGEDDNVSKIEALDSGADDYVVKPYNAGELLALVRAVLRRGVDTADSAGSLDGGDFLIDFDARRVYVGASEVRLTPKQFDLLVYLARRPGRVVPHARLLAAVWGVEYFRKSSVLTSVRATAPREARGEPVAAAISVDRAFHRLSVHPDSARRSRESLTHAIRIIHGDRQHR